MFRLTLSSLSLLHLAIQINRRQFYATLRRVVTASDIILEVLDARDPDGTRCYSLEHAATAQGKHIVLIVNKIGFYQWFLFLFDVLFRSGTKGGREWVG